MSGELGPDSFRTFLPIHNPGGVLCSDAFTTATHFPQDSGEGWNSGQSQDLSPINASSVLRCKEDICNGVGSLLVYVKSLKGLAAIRDAVWDLLSTESISQHWSTVCQRLLERPLAVWEDFLQLLFLQRLQVGACPVSYFGPFVLISLATLTACLLTWSKRYIFNHSSDSFLSFLKAITKEETEAISTSSVELLTSAVRDLEGQTTQTSGGTNPGSVRRPQYEVDVASFLWSESPGDLLSDAGWINVTQRGQQHQRSGLAMKTQALTPCVQNFCSSMDAKLKARLDDLQHYLPSQDTGGCSSDCAGVCQSVQASATFTQVYCQS